MAEDYDVVIPTVDDRERLADLLRKFYFKHSPMNTDPENLPDRPTDQIFALQFLHEGVSVMAVTKSGRIVGACINVINKPSDSHADFQHSLTNEGYVKRAILIHKMEQDVDVWKLTGADRALYMHALAVDPVTRGRGIGKVLMERSRDIARAAGFPLLRILTSSYYSNNIARSMGMENVYTIRYAEYKDENGVPIFSPPPPHTEITMFIQRLN